VSAGAPELRSGAAVVRGSAPGERPLAAWRMVALAGRAEAARLARSPLVVAGCVIAATLIWWNNRDQVPVWWDADIGVGSGMLAVAGGTLIAAQLAAGRARRDGMTRLYASYPAPARVRTGGLLLGVTGPLALAAVVTGGAVLWLASRGAAGAPQPAVLAGCLLLVALAGALGVALGSWAPHPMTGILTAVVLAGVELDLVLTFDGWVQPRHGLSWLFPWYQPGFLPSELPGISVPFPWAVHAAELAALTGLAVSVALWRAGGGRRVIAGLAIGCLAVTGWTAWSQTRPVPRPEVSALVDQTIHPARYEQCATRQDVRYCYYPPFRSLVSRWAAPVSGVLAHLPARPRRPLVVRQVDDTASELLIGAPPFGLRYDADQGSGRLARTLAGFEGFAHGLSANPALIPGSSRPPVYTDLSWGAGPRLGSSELGLAVSTAYWAVGLPTTAPQRYVRTAQGTELTGMSCVPVHQAREAIALWLAASATPAARQALPADMTYPIMTKIGRQPVLTYYVNGSGPAGIPPATAQGVRLAQAMLLLPARRVEAALATHWRAWLRPEATDGQLAAALGTRLPAARPARRNLFTGDVPTTVCG
jgi:hypothetical protein